MPKRTSIERESGGGWGGIFAVLIVALMIAGVLFAMLSGGPAHSADAKGLLLQAETSVKRLTSESFTFEGAVEVDSSAGFFSSKVSGEGRTDMKNRRQYLKVNFESPIMSADLDKSVEAYTIENTAYSKFAGQWMTYSGVEGWWESTTSEKLIELAKKFDSELSEKEVVNGENCYKVLTTPSMGELLELLGTMDPGLLQRAGIGGSFDQITAGVRSIEIIIWINEDEYLPVKAEFIVEAESKMVNPAGSGVIPVSVILSAEMNYDYKTPFNIVLPSEAREQAVEL